MKIAILLPGHIRFWKDCRENFIEKIYKGDHEFDVYIDSYFEIFRPEYTVNQESTLSYKESISNIGDMFKELNIVSLCLEEDCGNVNADVGQLRKLARVAQSYRETETNKVFSYDLVVRSRFDIKIESGELDYQHYFDITRDNMIVGVNQGPPTWGDNDMLAIGSSESMFKYLNRQKIWLFGDYDAGLQNNKLIDISIVRNC